MASPAPAVEVARDTAQGQLRRRLLIAVSTPLLVLVCVGAVLGWQVSQFSDNANWLDHTGKVIAKVYEIQKLIVDQETGLRGYLLTGDRTFLEPYHEANPLKHIGELDGMVQDSPEQKQRVDELRTRYQRWLDSASIVAASEDRSEATSATPMRQRKRGMDEVRNAANAVLNAENILQEQRTATLSRSNQMTRFVLAALLALAAAAITFVSRRNLSAVGETFNSALEAERKTRAEVELQTWVRTGQACVVEAMQGDRPLEDLCQRALRTLASYAEADVAALFVAEATGYRRIAGFALESDGHTPSFKRGEGLVGRAADDEHPLVIDALPDDYLPIRSGTGQRRPVGLVLAPARTDAVVYAVVELAYLRPVPPRVVELLAAVTETSA